MSKWTNEQLDAINKSGSNIIVSAGAGSGKTAVLSQRVISKLESGVHINELLILTFTNAAASEMKDRIRNKISSDPKLKNELELLSSSYITTFDSFALSVLKKYHYLLNISNDISITDESIVRLIEKKIIDEIFEDLYKNKNDNFLRLINNYCNKNDNNLRSNILKIASQINNRIDREEYINYIRNDYFSDENISRIINDFDLFIQNKKDNIKKELRNLEIYTSSDYITRVYESISELLNSNSESLYLFKSVSIPQLKRGSGDEAKNTKEILSGKIKKLISYGEYGSFNQIKDKIKESKKDIDIILDIVDEFIKRLDNYKRINNIYTFSDIAFLSTKILKENESVRKELKSSFKEIMIDEYQDTNDVQDIFINYISNNNVYMVGDIKQSIYKFRGSNPSIFKEKYDNYSNLNGGIKIDLIKNFRSRSEVLNNINNIFELIMDNSIGGANYRLNHEMIYGNTIYDSEKENDFDYDLDIFEYVNEEKKYTNAEIEIFKIATDIKKKVKSKIKVFDKNKGSLRSVTYNDFVIILDRSKYFSLYKKIFEYHKIPLTILKDEELNDNTDILLLKNLIDIVIKIQSGEFDTEFKYDFISIARSFLYEYTDDEIFKIFKNNSFKDSSIYKDLSSINNINNITTSMLLEFVLDKTNFYNKIYKIGQYNNTNVRLETLYNISSNLNSLGYDINGFIEYLNDIIKDGISIKYNAFNSSSDSVKIMTVHKSKGLEFPICYFADLDHKFNIRDLRDEFIVTNEYGLLVPHENEKSVIKELYSYNYLKEEIGERLRLLYVALTRAREKIIIVIPNKDLGKMELDQDGVIDEIRRLEISKLSDFIYYIKGYLESYFKTINIDELSLTKNYLFKNITNNKFDKTNIDFDVKEVSFDDEVIDNNHFSKELNNVIDKKEYELMKFGTYVHELLEYTDFKNIDLSHIKDENIKNKIEILLNNKIFSDIKDAKVFKEYEFNYNEDSIEYQGIIDLMIEHFDHIDIVDYKLKNIDDENYVKQLSGYKKYIEKKSNKIVNLYLYSILDEKIKQIN